MNEATTLKTLDRLIQLETRAVRTYDQALATVTDPVIREQLEELKARHADHAEQLSSKVLKMAHGMIAEHWDAITLAAFQELLPDTEPKMRIVSNG